MEINTKDLKEIIKKISIILNACQEATALNIKSSVDKDMLYFSLATGEVYSAVKLAVNTEDYFNATVDTKSFVDMVSGLAGETINLIIDGNILKLRSGKSKYKLAMLFKDGVLLEPKPMLVETPEVNVTVPLTILKSIDTINSQEFNRKQEAKIKNAANRLYHISDAGCLTAADNYGACLNSFKLDTQIEVLATRQLVKLFSLFDSDPILLYEHKKVNNIEQSIVNLTSDNAKICAYTTADPKIRAVIASMVAKIRQRAAALYQVNLVLNTKDFSAALGRLAIAAKHTSKALDDADKVKLTVVGDHVTITDANDNYEEIAIEASSAIVGDFHTNFFVSTVKPIVDMCKEETITIRSDLGKPFVIDFNTVKYMLVPLID